MVINKVCEREIWGSRKGRILKNDIIWLEGECSKAGREWSKTTCVSCGGASVRAILVFTSLWTKGGNVLSFSRYWPRIGHLGPWKRKYKE